MNKTTRPLAALLVFYVIYPLGYAAGSLDNWCKFVYDSKIIELSVSFLLPVLLVMSVILPSGIKRTIPLSILAAQLGFLYSSVITAVCPINLEDATLKSSTYLSTSPRKLWSACLLYTLYGSVLLCTKKDVRWHDWWLLIVTFVGSITFINADVFFKNANDNFFCANEVMVFYLKNKWPTTLLLFNFIVVIFLQVLSQFRAILIATFVNTGIVLSVVQYNMGNSCALSLHNIDSVQARFSVFLLAYAWIAQILCLDADPKKIKSIKVEEF